MRLLLSVGILFLGAASTLPAVTITFGTYFTHSNSAFYNSIGTVDNSFRMTFIHATATPICNGSIGSSCNVSFSQSVNLTYIGSTLPLDIASAIIFYNGTEYRVGGPTGANNSFVLNMSLNGPTVPVTLTACDVFCSVNPPAFVTSASLDDVPFTMTGSASLTVNGTPIFTNLVLSGEGVALYRSSIYPNSTAEATTSWAFKAEVPEPASFATGALGLIAVVGLRYRRHSTTRI